MRWSTTISPSPASPRPSNILERLRWKVGLGLVIVAAGFAANAAPSTDAGPELARSSWGFSSQSEAVDAVDVARSSWGFSSSSSSSSEAAAVVDVARSSWGFSADVQVDVA